MSNKEKMEKLSREGINLLLQTTVKKEIENCFKILGSEIRTFIVLERQNNKGVVDTISNIQMRYPCFSLEELIDEELYKEYKYELEIIYYEILKENIIKIAGGNV